MKPHHRPWQAIALFFSIAYAALLPQFYLMYDVGNRYTFGWSARYRASILISIFILGAAYSLGACLLHAVAAQLDKWQRRVSFQRLALDGLLWAAWIVLWRTASALAVLSSQMPDTVLSLIQSPITKLVLYALIPLIWLVWKRSRFEQFSLLLSKVAAILFAFFLVQAFWWDFYADDSLGKAPPASTPQEIAQGKSVYVFLFDEWSYEDTFGHPDFDLDAMPHLKTFLGESILFHNAYSPAVSSGVSMPRFLYQTDTNIFAYSFKEITRLIRGNQLTKMNLDSIFDLSESPYKIVLGSYLHYLAILGNKVDSIINFDPTSQSYTLARRVRDFLFTQVDFLRKFGVRMPTSIQSPLTASGWQSATYNLQFHIRPTVRSVLPSLPAQNIAFVHMYLPHNPYLFMRDWSPRGPIPEPKPPPHELYQENVYAVDLVLADIFRILKERGDYDSSMIVILSDHSWKLYYGESPEIWAELDSGFQTSPKHVPMIVKFPHQTKGGDWHEPVHTVDLHPYFRAFWQQPDALARWVEQWNAGETNRPLYAP